MHHEEELAIIREGIQAELNMKEEVCHIWLLLEIDSNQSLF
jgi:hypothetical protein